MKILCVIDSLGSGGAQRQMVNLACGLKERGHDVEVFVYFPQYSFFRSEIEAARIPVREISKGRGVSVRVMFYLAQLFRREKYDGVISFLSGPNLYAELARLLAWSDIPLVVGERSSSIGETSRSRSRLLRCMHCFASAVVANSESQSQWLRKYSWLRSRIHTIYNGYDVSEFQMLRKARNERPFRYLIVGRIQKDKNGLRLIDALRLYWKKTGSSPFVSWAGRQETDVASMQCRREMDDRLMGCPELKKHWEWLGERKDLPELLLKCDALIHVSLYEGLPNAVCEAFIAGCPVIASGVCDHPVLIDEPERGFLCDPNSPESICEAIERFEAQSCDNRGQQGISARKFAQERLSIDKMVSAYEKLITDLQTKNKL